MKIIILKSIYLILKGAGDYSLYGDYGQSNYGTLDGGAADPIPIEIPPEAIDQVYPFIFFYTQN